MDVARERARAYLRALPARDRVMLVRADALATPATAFEPDRSKVEDGHRRVAARSHRAATWIRRWSSRATFRGRTAGASARSPSSAPGRTAPRDPARRPRRRATCA